MSETLCSAAAKDERTLSADERDRVRALIEAVGEIQTAKMLDSCRGSVLRAAAGLRQSRAIRLLLRTRLAELAQELPLAEKKPAHP